MKRFILVGAALLALVVPAMARDVQVTVSSHNPTASLGDFQLSAMPHISNGAYLRSIDITNHTGAAATRVDMYRNATSSTAATLEFSYVVPASTTLHVDYAGRAYSLRNVGFRKVDANGTVSVNAVYE